MTFRVGTLLQTARLKTLMVPSSVDGIWNELLKEVVEADTIKAFKRNLHRSMDRKG